jgi:hypothetical protein
MVGKQNILTFNEKTWWVFVIIFKKEECNTF